MGELHLEVLVDRMRREFHVEANVGKPRVSYREALTKPVRCEGRFIRQTGGHGQFGHVWLELEPLEGGGRHCVQERHRWRPCPQGICPSRGERVREALNNGPPCRLPLGGPESYLGRRQLPSG